MIFDYKNKKCENNIQQIQRNSIGIMKSPSLRFTACVERKNVDVPATKNFKSSALFESNLNLYWTNM